MQNVNIVWNRDGRDQSSRRRRRTNCSPWAPFFGALWLCQARSRIRAGLGSLVLHLSYTMRDWKSSQIQSPV